MRLSLVSGPVVSGMATLSAASPIVTGIADTSRLLPGQIATGPGIQNSSLILTVDSATQVTLTKPAKTTGAAVVTFAIEPLSLADAKEHLRVTIPDDDITIAVLIAAARKYCEDAGLKQALITQTWRLYLDSFPSAGGYYNRAIRETWPSLGGIPSGLGFYPGQIPNSTGVIDLPKPPVQSVVGVFYYDFSGALQTVPTPSYTVSLGVPSRIQPAYSKVWPIARPTIDSVHVDFTCGYGDTPDTAPANVIAAMKLLIGNWYENKEATISGTIIATVPLAVEALLGASEHGSYS